MYTHPKTPCSPSSANESDMNSKLNDLSLEGREKEEVPPQPQTRPSWKEDAKREKYEIDLEKITTYETVKFINAIHEAVDGLYETAKNLDKQVRHLIKVLQVIDSMSEQERQKQQQQ